jgi:CDP-paratose synthetase
LKKILITGGNGFLGSNLVNKLSGKKYFLYLLVRKNSNLFRLNKNKKITFLFLDDLKLDNFFKKNSFDLIIHCATNYGLDKTELSEIIYPNLLLPLKLLDMAKKYNVKRFINTDTILNKIISGYSLSKYQFVDWLKIFSNTLYCCNVKIEHFYGPKDNLTKFVISVIVKLLNHEKEIDFTKGTQKRDFVYISDVVNALEKIVSHSLKKEKGYQTFEIGSGKAISVKYLVKLIAKLTNNQITKLNFGKLAFRMNEPMNVRVDLKNIKKLGWRNNVKLADGLKKTIKFYKQVS